MTFCTHCAAIISDPSEVCPSCGRHASASKPSVSFAGNGRQSVPRLGFLRFLYFSPVILVVVFVATFVQREAEHQTWLASMYAAGQSAAANGDLISARNAFSSLVNYRDSQQRALDIEQQLAPLEAGYANGLRAIERGEYEAAIASLGPVVEQAPNLRDAATRLEDAKRLFAGQLTREVDAAETVRDWASAERTLRKLIALDAANPDVRQRLGTLQREHGPLVLGRDRALWLVSPDGSEENQLTDSLQVIWPAWSPDRSQIAFLAPDPDDPVGNVSLYVVGLDGLAPKRLANGVSAHAAPAWSPDGKRIAYTSFAGYDPVYETGSIGVRFVDVVSGHETDLTGADHSLAFNPAWSPDGTKLAFIVKYQGMEERPQHSPGDVFIATIGNTDFENLTNGAVRHVWSVAWSPLGDRLLLYSLFGQTWYEPPSTSIRILNRETGAIEQIAGIDDRPTMPAWSPDGSHFAFTVEEKRVVIRDGAGNERSVDASEVLSGEITWSPDGQALILAPWNAESSSIFVELLEDEPELSTIDLEFDASSPFISPPQWAPAVAIAPLENPSVPLPDAEVEATPAP
jgi:dipeptidyl aminopeptidase/acylaminoacyl peptidase